MSVSMMSVIIDKEVVIMSNKQILDKFKDFAVKNDITEYSINEEDTTITVNTNKGRLAALAEFLNRVGWSVHHVNDNLDSAVSVITNKYCLKIEYDKQSKQVIVDTANLTLLKEFTESINRFGWTCIDSKSYNSATLKLEIEEAISSGELFPWEVDDCLDIEIDTDEDVIYYNHKSDDSIERALEIKKNNPHATLKTYDTNDYGDVDDNNPYSNLTPVSLSTKHLRVLDSNMIKAELIKDLTKRSLAGENKEQLHEAMRVHKISNDYLRTNIKTVSATSALSAVCKSENLDSQLSLLLN